MIKIDIFRNQADKVIGFSVHGHANTAPHGYDIVCAAVSSLTQTAVIGLERYLQSDIKLEVESGNLSLELIDSPDSLTSAILETMLLGLNEIAKQNSRSVQIKEHRR